MKPRERLDKALRFEEPDRPPHFENGFELSKQALGLEFPSQEELYGASEKEREKLYGRCAAIYEGIIGKYGWDAATIWFPGGRDEIQYGFIRFLRKYLGDDFPILNHIWDSFVSLETVKDYMSFSVKLMEEPEQIHQWAKAMMEAAWEHAQRSIDAGVYGIVIANDSAFNSGPFLSPAQHAEFCAPYVRELAGRMKKQGARIGYHTDGNLMKILDQIMDMGVDFLHSVDPMAGMDIREVKEKTYGRLALMGNVQCSFLQTGPAEDIVKSAEYCLEHGTKGGGYIYSSSNIIFSEIPLENYEIMTDCYKKYCSKLPASRRVGEGK
jgi:uroporphyrinogen decarboxylase